YQVDGLPPTPIGTVSLASLGAALHPADTDYLFYVLADHDGSHAFAETYEQHQANVQAARRAGVLP
ncbi:MAG: endolytic transglycosylase MltG, partial [Acidimicrobiia bacterium]|nr:endolytic transglycosylase MltG [Acidimicrobiia bacterium]